MMSTLYVLNNSDPDIRACSWQIIFTTIAFFVGILLCTAFNGLVVFFILGPDAGPGEQIFVDAGCVLMWFVILEVVLGLATGAIGSRKARQVKRETIKRDVKCYSTFLGLILAYSNLNFWGTLQHLIPAQFALQHLIPPLITIPLACASLMFLFKVAETGRNKMAQANGKVEDEDEKEFIAQTKMVEDNVVSLVLAHLTVQSVRMYITGQLPIPMGADPPGLVITMQDCYSLGRFTLLFLALSPLISKISFGDSMTEKRLKLWLKKTCGNSVTFTLLYNTFWFVHVQGLVGSSSFMLAALMLTLFTYVLIFALDWIADQTWTGEAVDEEIRFYIQALALLLGFAWKQAFVVAIGTVTAKYTFLPAPIETSIVSVLVAIVVVPAWRLYILPPVMHPEWHAHWMKVMEPPEGYDNMDVLS